MATELHDAYVEIQALRERVHHLETSRAAARRRAKTLDAANVELENKNAKLLRRLNAATAASPRAPAHWAARKRLKGMLKKYHPDKASGLLSCTEVAADMTALLSDLSNGESG